MCVPSRAFLPRRGRPRTSRATTDVSRFTRWNGVIFRRARTNVVVIVIAVKTIFSFGFFNFIINRYFVPDPGIIPAWHSWVRYQNVISEFQKYKRVAGITFCISLRYRQMCASTRIITSCTCVERHSVGVTLCLHENATSTRPLVPCKYICCVPEGLIRR